MNIDWITIVMFVSGVLFSIFGFNLLFKKGFVEKLRDGLWKSSDDGLYNYDKYGRGIRYLLSGLTLLGFSIYVTFFP